MPDAKRCLRDVACATSETPTAKCPGVVILQKRFSNGRCASEVPYLGDAAHCEEEHDNPWMTECRQGCHSHGPFKRSLQDEAPEKWYVPDCTEREKRGHAQAPTECGGCPDAERAEDARGCRSEVRNDVFGHVDGRGPVDDGRQWTMDHVEDAKRCLFLLLG